MSFLKATILAISSASAAHFRHSSRVMATLAPNNPAGGLKVHGHGYYLIENALLGETVAVAIHGEHPNAPGRHSDALTAVLGG